MKSKLIANGQKIDETEKVNRNRCGKKKEQEEEWRKENDGELRAENKSDEVRYKERESTRKEYRRKKEMKYGGGEEE